MNWITTSGRTLDEAKSNALDQLGIVADEAEFDVINDVEKGFFGRVKTEAKIRARVRPKQPSVKDDRRGRSSSNGNRNRNRNRKKGGNGGGNKGNGGSQNRGNGNQNRNQGAKGNKGNQNANQGNGGSNKGSGGQGNQRNKNKGNQDRGGAKTAAAAPVAKAANDAGKKEKMEATISREEQENIAKGFLEGVLGAFSMSGDVSVVEEAADDDAIEMAVTGQELGLLVGPKGNTLSALQELTRTVVQRNAEGAKTDRLRVDVAGYRARRTAALGDFARKIAEEVVDSGNEKLLEPMGAADRKVVHDALTDFDGVETGSEGEEPRRRVVIRPTA